jgi:hypothetical protein
MGMITRSRRTENGVSIDRAMGHAGLKLKNDF